MGYFDFDFSNSQWYPADDIFSLVHPPSLQLLLDFNFPLLSPPTTTPEQSETTSLPHPLSPELPLAGPSAGQLPSDPPSPELPLAGPSTTHPPAGAQSTPLLTTQPQVQQPTPTQISQFDFCPFTEGGVICGFVSWTCSSHKAIERHLKQKHFGPESGAKIWKCPNPDCRSKGRPFYRSDALRNHRRRTCDPEHLKQDPTFVPLSHIVEGSDLELKRWRKAGADQRKLIKAKLQAGTPWTVDLLKPIHL